MSFKHIGQAVSREERDRVFRRKLNVKEAANYLGVSESWLNKSRLDASGPAFSKIGRRCVYDENDLEEFLSACKRRSVAAA